MRNQEALGSELNPEANGGTEQVVRRLFDLLDPSDLEGVQLIASRVRELDPDKFRIYHLHDLPHDPEASHLSNEDSRKRFDRLVFVSNWQYTQFQNILGVPRSVDYRVIENGVDPIALVPRPDPRTNPIKLIYTSTPHRGLEILIPVFEMLADVFNFIELDIYSSFKLYGWEQRDEPYAALFERAKNHPRIRYHGSVAPEVVRKAYQDAHIFAYPSIWPETSCRCLIEAMMAGCLCVHPNFAALPETSGGLTDQYDSDQNPQVHAQIFAEHLAQIIGALRNSDVYATQGLIHRRYLAHSMATIRFGWPNVIQRWKTLLADLKSHT